MPENYSASQLSGFLEKWKEGSDENISNETIQFIYDELRRLARSYLRKERAGHTLQTTALVHEAYLKLKQQNKIHWESRTHFMGIAATLMRRILIDYAKAKHRDKRGGAAADNNLELDEAITIAASQTNLDLLALDEALERFAEKEPYLTKVVELRFFSGLDIKETAEVLGVSESTVKRDWAMAKAWLHRELTR